LIVSCLLSVTVVSPELAAAGPAKLLVLPGSGTDPEQIDYDRLPRIEGDHAIVSPAAIHSAEEDLPDQDHHATSQLSS